MPAPDANLTVGTVDPEWAWAPFEPDAEHPWTHALAAHLFRRAGFGATWAELQQAVADGPGTTLRRLTSGYYAAQSFHQRFDELEPANPGSATTVSAWWLRRMIETPDPFDERMTLFWHSSLAIRADRVGDPGLLAGHIRRLRLVNGGPLQEVFDEQLSDPAVLQALGGGVNRRARPNTELARAFLDDLTLGPGVATHEDVNDVARMMTGWFVVRGKLRFIEREQDRGGTHLHGRAYPVDRAALPHVDRGSLPDVVRDHPSALPWLARRLYRAYISEADDPPAALIESSTKGFCFLGSAHHLAGMMLRSNLFYSPLAMHRRVKSPVELAVGLARALEGIVPTEPLAQDLANLGQDLANPPTLRGWPGGRAWITDATMTGRLNLLHELLQPDGRYKGRLDPARTMERHGRSPSDDPVGFFTELLGLPPEPGRADEATSPREVVARLVARPEYQLA